MKKRSIAFLLSLVMLLSLLTPTALAEEPDQEGQATEERTEIPALSETAVAVPREAAFGDETTVTAPEGAESYQWQFRLMEGLWVNISGDESAAIVLTYAKVCNMLDENGEARLRCLVDGLSDDSRYDLTARTPGNRLVRVVGDKSALGQFQDVKITGANKWSLFGELA